MMRPAVAALTLLVSSSTAFTPPGLLAGLVEQKRREVEQLNRLPDSREDGPWGLRLRYPASESSFKLARAIGWRRDTLAVFADLKRASPGEAIGLTEPVDPQLDVIDAVQLVMRRKLDGALVCTDQASYGGSGRDLVSAAQFLEGSGAAEAAALPIVAKDLIIDPIQIAQAISQGADAVLLVASAAADLLPELLDACTLMGCEAVVEVHTPDEVLLAERCGASILLVNERDRATGRLLPGHASTLAPALPPDTTCLACGGIHRIDQVRVLRRAGYDGVVLGRVLAGPDGENLLAQIAADNEVAPLLEAGRAVEIIRTPPQVPMPHPEVPSEAPGAEPPFSEFAAG